MTADATGGPCTLLEWDSRFWGFTIARVDSLNLSPALLCDVEAWCTAHHVRCLYFRANGSCPLTLAMAETAGFRFVDVRIELSRALQGSRSADDGPHGGIIRPATNKDLTALQDLAARTHRDTRFFKDNRFDTVRAAELYRTWIARDFSAHAVMVCETPTYPGRPCGYVTCEYGVSDQEGRIGLIAVAPEFSGKGLGRLLLQSALDSFLIRGIRIAKVVTQATNVPAMRLYEAAGFRTADVSVWFHKWFPEAERA